MAGQVLRSTLEQGEQRGLRASKRSPGHNSRTGINRVGGYLLPVHGRWRRTTEKGRFDPLAAPSGMTAIRAQRPLLIAAVEGAVAEEFRTPGLCAGTSGSVFV